ncbi:MAG: B12-binding domain-containing radical SAM protein [Desulfobacterales bacterium]|nr:B12-binding domain-containing radical SAM protein [Desulfobacterales bacterium]
MKRNVIVLFLPNYRWFDKRPWEVMPVTVAVLTRIFKDAGLELRLVDANIGNLTEQEALEALQKAPAKVVLVTSLSIEYYRHFQKSMQLIKTAQPDCTTVFGGIYPTVLPEESLEIAGCDYIFLGPAEGRAPAFIRALLAGDTEAASRMPGIGYRPHKGPAVINPVSHADNRPTPVDPDYSLIDVRAYLDAETFAHYQYTLFEEPTAMLNTSFGCVHNCLFCAARTIRGRQVHFRPAASVLDEIDWFYNAHGVRHFSIVDDLFLADRKRAVHILQQMIDRDYRMTWKVSVSAWHLDDEILELMKTSGCVLVFLFVESGSPRVLKKIIRKPLNLESLPAISRKCRELDLLTSANYVIGFPGETWDEIRTTFRVAEELDFDYSTFCIATPFPKTDLYKICREQNLLPDDFDFRNPAIMGLGQGFITTDEFTPLELMTLRAYEWDRINFSSPTKISRVARILNLDPEQLTRHRRDTRRKLGLHHQGAGTEGNASP